MILDLTDEETEVLYEALMEHAADLARKMSAIPSAKSPTLSHLQKDKAMTMAVVRKLRAA